MLFSSFNLSGVFFSFPFLVSPIEIRKDNEKVEGKFTTAVDLEEVDLSTSCVKADTLPINESTKNGESNGESLKCSSVELQTLAKDSGLVIEDTNQEPQMENLSSDANVPNPQACQSSNNNEANLNERTSLHQSDAGRPNLMKPNSTAQTHEVTLTVFCRFCSSGLLLYTLKRNSLTDKMMIVPCL